MKNFIKISNVQINRVSASSLNGAHEGVFHRKILNTLSVVQVTEGSYTVSLDNGAPVTISEGKAFIAPAGVVQNITHHDGSNGIMKARWIFINAVINNKFRFDEVYEFPILLDGKYLAEVGEIISEVLVDGNYFTKTINGYKLLKILAEVGKQKTPLPPIKTKIENYVKENYHLNINGESLARHLFCSTAQAFRYTKKYFGLTPSHYINGIRLQQAETQLVYSQKTVTEIAFLVGFTDTTYFAKLFRRHFGYSPTNYRAIYGIS